MSDVGYLLQRVANAVMKYFIANLCNFIITAKYLF
jgi:hypothetical protein